MRTHFPHKRRLRGVTTLELLVALLVVSIVMTGVYVLVGASYQSYQDLVWQNKVNQEARQALDEVCDTIRFSGLDSDLIRPAENNAPQVYGNSDGNQVGVTIIGGIGNQIYFQSETDPNSNTYYLTRLDLPDKRAVSQFVDTVHFEYEYRTPAGPNDKTWQMKRVSEPSGDVNYLIKTVYVTVTATIPSSVTHGQTYSRTLTSAATLRGPYNSVVPPALRYPATF